MGAESWFTYHHDPEGEFLLDLGLLEQITNSFRPAPEIKSMKASSSRSTFSRVPLFSHTLDLVLHGLARS